MAARERLHLLGIRHHGPGSARAVLAALEAQQPAIVLIEGPPDADDMIVFANSPAMVPPVALLVHAQDDPGNASFYPFANFSPEWQAMRWAITNGRAVRFMDLPMAHRLAERAEQAKVVDGGDTASSDQDGASGAPAGVDAVDDGDFSADADADAAATAGAGDDDGEQTDADATDAADVAEREQLARIRRDPLAFLARIAGYEDSESWWNALIEQGSGGPEVFGAIEAAMTALRERFDPVPFVAGTDHLNEQRREAHMRRSIATALSETEGPVAVVCGAWHVPALRAKASAKDDRALLRGLAKIKVTATWVPWTETRLASASGYGAGVVSPGWYQHLWDEADRSGRRGGSGGLREPGAAGYIADLFTTRWQARVADLLRRNGRPASTASVIEASRLALTLAGLRDLALPGLEEMREASLATLCEGETAPLRMIEDKLVIGERVGEIDEAVPQMPLAADLARWQRKLKLKPEALPNDISIDLRSETGGAKSLLLHRLNLIKVPWGRLQDAGRSRGSFRENWRLAWEPEFSVKLAEALVYGTTVEQAAGNCAVSTARQAASLDEIAALVRACLDAGLDAAAAETILILQTEATSTSDIGGLAGAIPPLVEVMRYGTARNIPTEALALLVTSLTEAVCAGLDYACRNLQREPAIELSQRMARLDVAMTLVEDVGLVAAWQRVLSRIAADDMAHALLRGRAVRALYDRGVLEDGTAAGHLSRALSPSVEPATAGDWIDGFLGDSGQVLLHDEALRQIMDRWLTDVGEEEFITLVPVLRRGFASFDMSERRRLLDLIVKSTLLPAGAAPDSTDAVAQADNVLSGDEAPGFGEALPLLYRILGLTPPGTGGDAA